MSDVSINYKGSSIATMDSSGTKTLHTEGKYCEDNIEVVYVSPGGGGSTLGTKTITANDTYDASDDDLDGYSQVTVNVPASAVDTGTKNINTNGTHDVTGYASAAVSVPASAVDTGTKNISANGTHDVTGYASASVNVPASAVDSGTKSITANGNNQDVVGYAAVNVNVPNSYAAGDEGKVVSNGALVAQGSDTVTQNGTVDTTLISSLTVNVSGGGGGLTPPVNALAQFEVSATVTEQPTTMTIDFNSICALMTANRTYVYSLILWRDDVVSASSYTYIVDSMFVVGRINSTGGLDANIAYDFGTTVYSMTSGVNLNAATLVSSKSVTNKVLAITLAQNTTRDRTGKWKGVFTLLPPWTDEYTGTKLTSCPTGFLAFS